VNALPRTVSSARVDGAAQAQLRTLITHAPLCLAMLDRELRYLVVSAGWREQFTHGDTDLVGRAHYEVVPELLPHWRDSHRRALQGEVVRNDLDFWCDADGQAHWSRWVVQPWHTEDQRVGGIIVGVEDLSTQMRLRESDRIASVAFDSADAMMITDAQGVIRQVNRAFCVVTGYSVDEAVGHTPRDLLHSGRQGKAFYRTMWRTIARAGVWRGELLNRRKNGEVFPQYLTISAVRDAAGAVTHYVAMLQDISLRKQHEATIHRLAYYDEVTGLPNRRRLLEQLTQRLRAAPHGSGHTAVLAIDLDDFGALNDSLGHAAGDQLLAAVGTRLGASRRRGALLARPGGDEFVLVLDNLGEATDLAASQAQAEAERIDTCLAAPFRIAGREWSLSACVGIALHHGADGDAETLLKHAELSLHRAKAEGRNTVRFFDPALQASAVRRLDLEAALRRAVEADEFVLHYQAQVDRRGHIVGFESLLRWQRPAGVDVSPAEFIPLAEETGLILPLGEFALRAACQQLAAWDAAPHTAGLSIAVNVSARQFQQADFVDSVHAALAHSGARAAQLKLELTESLLLTGVDQAISKMQALRALGVRFSLDDFGTGYSSLAYLKRLPLEQLKIDRSFVTDLLVNASDAVIARAIIRLAHNLNLTVVAEGVEDMAVWQQLRSEGCDIGQGYLFARPLPLSAAEALLARCQPASDSDCSVHVRCDELLVTGG
jgi:diguanylate cyclase (GGDEF)-like protein/PAS domain S-box-containing protein